MRVSGSASALAHPIRQGQGFALRMNPVGAETGTGKPPFKASEGGQIYILRELEDITPGELQQGSGTQVLFVLKVRPETFPNGSPMPV
jgi:hypothetical protein